ncbi:MAG: hypothetical protein GVY17_07110 [Cyanobacteria bacterium]|jgi:chemotaxis signal transduction protein|nr:hypothetical protein [Cyanobacteria bacterium GSL.Bin21]
MREQPFKLKNTPQLVLPEQGKGERFLTFPINPDQEGLVSLEALQGVVQVDLSEILPIPETAAALLGILSWRGEALWSVDLTQLLGGSHSLADTISATPCFSAIATNQGKSLALLVEKFSAVTTYNREQALLPMQTGMVAPELAQYCEGYFLQEDRATPQFLLNLDVIFEILD